MSGYSLEMLGITKSFPGVKCLDNVDLKVKKGEVHALLGENGAGKSTLMKILSGAYKQEEGTIKLEGLPVTIGNPQAAIDLGISIIYQEFNLVPQLTVIENVLLGHEASTFGWLNLKEEEERATKWLDYVCQGMIPDYRQPVCNYSVAQQQMIEISKALSLQAKILVMDEPTAALTDKEMHVLFDIIRKLKDEGITVIYISHRLEEIFAICDRVTILRDGKQVGSAYTKDIDKSWLIRSMIGRELSNTYPERQIRQNRDCILNVNKLSSGKFKDVSFQLHEGEILGFSGLVGSGRTEVMRAIFGADRFESGSIEFCGQKLDNRHPCYSVKNGFAFATEDRKHQGLFLNQSIKHNITISSLKNARKGKFLNFNAEKEIADKYMKELKIVATNSDKLCKELSGGNQQKVVLAKWLSTNCRVLILDEPTRGIDVGAKYEIYLLMEQLVQNGVSIIMVSSELPEVIAMSDRIVVMHNGGISGIVPRETATEEVIMTYATGGVPKIS